MRWKLRPVLVACATVLLCAVMTAVTLAETMTAKDVVRLKRLGFSDAEIRAAVDKSDGKIDLSDADAAELKAAGAGDDLIAAVRAHGAKPLDVAAIMEMVKANKPVDQILSAMAGAPAHYNLTPAQALDLARQNCPTAVLLALKGNPLGIAELKLLADSKPASSIYQQLAALLGFTKQDLPPADALALSQAGVPDEILKALKEGKAATIVAAASASDLKEYQQIAHYFTIHYPQSWNAVRAVDNDLVEYSFTPESGKTKADDMDLGLSVELMTIDQDSPMAGMDPATMLKHLLPALRASQPGLTQQGDITSDHLGKLTAACITVKGTVKKKTGVYIGKLYLAEDQKMIYLVADKAPEAQYDAYKGIYQQIIDNSQFGIPFTSHRGSVQEASDLIGKYKESVVSILAIDEKHKGGWSGTGFIIQKDGYVATNCHVAVDLDTGEKATKYFARWDASTGRKQVPLTFVGCRFHPSRFDKNYGEDVALFKLPPGNYTALPLTPLRDVQQGDSVVTMGFPHVSDFASIDMFTTSGIVTRFNRTVDGVTETLFIDAKITHGNSGGPCIDRVTGGVIGLNTFGQDIETGNSREAHRENDLVGYNGVVPTDRLMEEFPLVAELGLDPDSAVIDYCDCYSLAHIYMEKGRMRAACALAERAIQLQPTSPEAHCLLGACRLQAALESGRDVSDFSPTVPQAVSALEEALQCQPDHEASLLMLSNLYLRTGDLIKATQYADRAVKAHPDDFQTYYQQAIIYDALQRYDDALASANKAIELAHDVRAEGHCMAGRILYEQKKYDQGKVEFEKASAIHPTNLMARLGIGEYYELTQNYQSALVEYGRVDTDIPNSAAVMTCIGRSYYELHRYDDALENYGKALERCEVLGVHPATEVFFNMGAILSEVQKKPASAVEVYGRGLQYYGDTQAGAVMHERLSKIFREAKYGGIAFSDLCCAAKLDPENQQVKQALAAHDLPLMSMDDILALVKKIDFPTSVIVDMVTNTPLDFKVTINSRDDVSKLEGQGLPDEVIQAIIDSNKAFPPNGHNGGNPVGETPGANPGGNPGGNPAQPEQPEQPANDPAHPAALVGTWSTSYQSQQAGAVSMGITFAANGRYALVVIASGGRSSQDQGQWSVQNGQLLTKSDNQQGADTIPFQINGDVMDAQIQGVGTLRFTRKRN